MAAGLLGSVGALIGTMVGLHQAVTTPGTSSHRPPSVKRKARRVHPYRVPPKSARALHGSGSQLQIAPPQHQRPVGDQVHPQATARAMAKRKRASSKRRSRKPKRGKKSFKRKSTKRRRGGKPRRGNKQQVRGAIMDILQQDRIFTYTAGEIVDCPVATANQPNYVYKLLGCRGVAATTLYESAGETYAQPHISIMANVCHPAVGNLTTNFLVNEYKYQTRILNESTGFVTIHAYKCRWREDMSVNTSAINLFQLGLIENNMTGGTATANASLWTPSGAEGQVITPFMSPNFCQYVKVDKVLKVVLGPGKQKTLSLNSKKRRIFRPGKYVAPTDQTTSYITAAVRVFHIKNSRFWMLRVEGQLADTAPDAGLITMTHPKLAMLSEYQYHFKCVDPNISAVTSGGCAGLAAGIALTESIVNPLTATVAVFDTT